MKVRKKAIFKKAWIEIFAESDSWGDLDFGEGQYAKSASRFWKKGRFAEARNRSGFARPRE